MRLISVDTYQLQDFPSHETPPYAILSHTWGDDEVSLKDLQNGDWTFRADRRKGRDKIEGCCAAAAAEGYGYVWIDTCCIDKTSSAELSEAINSMFRWYHDSAICYAYLSDVESSQDPGSSESEFAKSRWFTRGWTLQELLAPTEIVFLGRDWGEIGTKQTLQGAITTITRISSEALADRSFDKYSVAQKMSWAAGRCTTRPEDEAYCLLGLFDVNMPLLYGEGERAFFRLQEEIMKRTDDESIFAWSYPPDQQTHVQLTGLLSSSPNFFRDSSSVAMKTHSAKRAIPGGAVDSTEGYLNPFELVRQLVRVRLPTLGPLKGIELQIPASGTGLGSVFDVESSIDRPLEDLQDEIQDEQDVDAMEIDFAYETGSDHSSIAMKELEDGIQLIPSRDRARNRAKRRRTGDSTWELSPHVYSVQNGNSSNVTDEDAPIEDDAQKSTEDVGQNILSHTWRWYIYEPVFIVPLMCSVDGKALGILVSRGSFGSKEEGVLSRLHSPSLIYIESLTKFAQLLSASRSLYVYGSASFRGNEATTQATYAYEIRIANLIQQGYILLQEQGSEWSYDERNQKLVKVLDRHQSRDSLFVFCHESQDSEKYPTFFMEIDFEEPVVGILSGSTIPLLGQHVWTALLDGQSRAEISMAPTEKFIVLKLRNTSTVKYLSLSIEQQASRLRGAKIAPVLRGLGGFNMRLQRIWSSLLDNSEKDNLDAKPQNAQAQEGKGSLLVKTTAQDDLYPTDRAIAV